MGTFNQVRCRYRLPDLESQNFAMLFSFPGLRTPNQVPPIEDADIDRVPGITRYAPA